jgi:hypothetical protein
MLGFPIQYVGFFITVVGFSTLIATGDEVIASYQVKEKLATIYKVGSVAGVITLITGIVIMFR